MLGRVHQGSLIKDRNKNNAITIAIKTLKEPHDEDQRNTFIYEIRIMSFLEKHPNLVNMSGTYTSSLLKEAKTFLFLEYCSHGDLKNFLIRNKDIIASKVSTQTDHSIDCCCILMKFSHDVAKGMQYLSRNKIMHGDLAARNVLVDETKGNVLVAKVSDFGLSKQFHDNISYKKEKRLFLPWRWMAYELFKDGLLTLTSDVWSYGVLIWEILSLGELPYYRKTQDEVIEILRIGRRLPCPKVVSKFPSWRFNDFYEDISKQCFHENPLKRPCFSEILTLIESYIPDENADICVAK